MFLKKFSENKMITIDYDNDGALKTYKGRVYSLNLKKQILSLVDEQQNLFSLKLSGIRNIN